MSGEEKIISPCVKDRRLLTICHIKVVIKSCEIRTIINLRDNYSKPTWGLARFHFTYPWFKTLHFAHLKLVPLAFRNPPLRLPSEKHIFSQKQI